MSETHTTGTSFNEAAAAVRTRAAIALALAVIGLLGGGLFLQVVQWALLEPFNGSEWIGTAVTSSAVPAAFGAGAMLLGRAASQTTDAVAVPLGRTALVLGLIAVVGSVLNFAAVALNYAN